MPALIIVESPTKARTFTRILAEQKDKYTIVASVGHFRDLPSGGINIDLEHNFEPTYAIDSKKENIVAKLRELAKTHKEIILATDEDREGESIAYHIAYILGYVKEKWPEIEMVVDLKRIVFHEITTKAIEEALANPSHLRLDLVKAQQARRILDRIVGYKLSPVLWDKLGKNWLSAGRVQTVGLRLIVEREKEILAFDSRPYFNLFCDFEGKGITITKSKLLSHEGVMYEGKKELTLFAGKYEYTTSNLTQDVLENVKTHLENDTFEIKEVKESKSVRFPPPPFTTSSLQIESYRQLSFAARFTMKLAQTLYEKGLITYHRTDSFNLGAGFVFGAKDFIVKKWGEEYALPKPRGYKTKSKGAQQAHEAIRPTKLDRTPSSLASAGKLKGEVLKLYDLIYRRALATQMAEAKISNLDLEITSAKKYGFESHFEKCDFPGFLVLTDKDKAKNTDELPVFEKGTKLTLSKMEEKETKTKAPYRYNEGSLVKALEENGIGRPSTYASILSNIQDKQYVAKERGYFVPTPLGNAVSDYLSSRFTGYFDLDFTSQMEERLDGIESGGEKMVDVIRGFYEPLRINLESDTSSKQALVVTENFLDEKCPLCDSPLVVKFGRYGKFTPCSRYPECKYVKKDLKYVEGKTCPLDAGKIVSRFSPRTRRRFFGCENYPACNFASFTIEGLSISKEDFEAQQAQRAEKAALTPPKKAVKKKVVKKKVVKKKVIKK